MARFSFRNILGIRQDSPNQGVSKRDIVKLLDTMGYDAAEDREGHVIPLPRDVNITDIPSFASHWSKLFDNVGAHSENRTTRIASYERMDGSGAESALILDTYADEVLNITDTADHSVMVEISDPEIEKKIKETLSLNGLADSAREDIRSLGKYGDFAYTITGRQGEDFLRLDEATVERGTRIERPLRPQDIVVTYVKSPDYELQYYKQQIYKLSPSKTATNYQEGREYNPWEFSFTSIRSRDTFPYGMSVLEKVRVPWEQLTVLEQLLAITRANKLDRIAVMVPSGTGDVTSVLKKLSMLKNFVKSVILNTSNNQRLSRNQDMGLTDYLWLPDSFKVERLSTSIGTADIEDVNYFRDKYYNASRLPKGFFIAENADTQTRPYSLRQQDLKFSRTLIPVGEAYCRGEEKRLTLLAFYLGADISKVKIKVSLKKSPYISSELLQTYKDVIELVNNYTNVRQAIDSTYKITNPELANLLEITGTPLELFFGKDKVPQMEGIDLSRRFGSTDTWRTHQPIYTGLLEKCRIA